MGFLSTHLPPSSPAPRPRSLKIRAAAAAAAVTGSGAASPSSFRPRPKRRNSLLPKLPKTHIPEPRGPPPPPPPEDSPTAHLLVIEEAVVFEESVQEAEGVDPFPPSSHGWFSKPVLDLALRFALLLAVQTVAAVWLLGGGGSGGSAEEVKDAGNRVEELGEVGEEVLNFERRVSEIQAMAREARASEIRGVVERNGVNGEARDDGSYVEVDEMDAVSPSIKKFGGKNTGSKLNSARRNGTSSSARIDRKAPEGFDSYKGRDEHEDSGDGGLQQTAHQNLVGESAMPHEISESNKPYSDTSEKLPGVKTCNVPPSEDLPSVSSLHTPKEGSIGRSKSCSPSVSEMGKHGDFLDATDALSFRGSSSEKNIQSRIPTSVGSLHIPKEVTVGRSQSGASSLSEMGHHGGSLDDTDGLSSRGSSSGNSTQSGIPSNSSLIEIGSTELEIQAAQNFTKENSKSSTVSRNSQQRYDYSSQVKGVEHRSISSENNSKKLNFREKPWWMKLPYVFAILLHRGSDRNGPKGLYSLKVNSRGDDKSFPSYTVAFQDRADATNFCFILDSFFEDLGDFSADAVPLTIQELNERVESDVSKVIVVRKGQLRLYAGQLLTDVETVLHSFLE